MAEIFWFSHLTQSYHFKVIESRKDDQVNEKSTQEEAQQCGGDLRPIEVNLRRVTYGGELTWK